MTDLGTLGGLSAAHRHRRGQDRGMVRPRPRARSGPSSGQNGTMTGLGTLAGGFSGANAINALGHSSAGASSRTASRARSSGGTARCPPSPSGRPRTSTRPAGSWGPARSRFPCSGRRRPIPRHLPGSITVGLELFLSDRNWTTDPAVDTVAAGTRVTGPGSPGRQWTHRAVRRVRPASPAAGYWGGRSHAQLQVHPARAPTCTTAGPPREHVRPGGSEIVQGGARCRGSAPMM